MLIACLLSVLHACVLKTGQDYFCHIFIIRPMGEVLLFIFKLSGRFSYAPEVENLRKVLL